MRDMTSGFMGFSCRCSAKICWAWIVIQSPLLSDRSSLFTSISAMHRSPHPLYGAITSGKSESHSKLIWSTTILFLPTSYRQIHRTMKTKSARQFLQYIAVGGTCTTIDFVVLYLLTTRCGVHYLVSSCISFSIGIVLNWFLCTYWVFQYHRIQQQSTTTRRHLSYKRKKW